MAGVNVTERETSSVIVEATVVYRSGTDPRDESQEATEKRLFNLDAIRLITPHAGGKRAVFHLREGTPAFCVVVEPYEYWSLLLTGWQARRQP